MFATVIFPFVLCTQIFSRPPIAFSRVELSWANDERVFEEYAGEIGSDSGHIYRQLCAPLNWK